MPETQLQKHVLNLNLLNEKLSGMTRQVIEYDFEIRT
jgi:hypothetical protein